MRLASFAMYDFPPAIQAANDAFWAYVRDGLRQAGIDEVPDRLDDRLPLHDVWLHPDMLLSQTCGYPYVTGLRGRVSLVATPVYSHACGVNGDNGSLVVVRRTSPVEKLVELRGARAAINGATSNSGMNLFRRLVAPHAAGGRFFSNVVETGSHLASLKAVADDGADAAAIDCVTYGNLSRHAPERLADVRVLTQTLTAPGLPLITRGGVTPDELEILRRVLRAFIDEHQMAGVRDTLSLVDFEIIPDRDYDRLLELEKEAADLGYPELR